MYKKRYKKYITVFISFHLSVIIIFFKTANADGWLQKKGHGLFISSFSLQSFYGKNTDNNEFDKNKSVLQSVLNLYGEYGLTNRITIGTKIIGINNDIYNRRNFLSKTDGNSIGVDTMNVFARFGIIRNNDIINFSITSQIGAPNLYSKDQSYFSIHCWSYESRAELGLNLTKNDFFTLSVGWHSNINYWYDEIQTNAVFGHYFIPEFLVIAQFQKYVYVTKNAMHADDSFYNTIAQLGFAKASLSFVVSISNNCMFEMGFYSSIRSRVTFTQKLNLHLRGVYTSIWWLF